MQFVKILVERSHANVYQIFMETHTFHADLNVLSIAIVHQSLLVSIINVRILVKMYAALEPFVKQLIITQCAFVSLIRWVIHMLDVNKSL